VEVSVAEVLVAHELLVEGHGGFYAFYDELIEGALHFGDALFAGAGAADEFSDHGVVVRRYVVSGIDVGVYADAVTFGGMQRLDSAGAGSEAVEGVFGIDAALHGMRLREVVVAGDVFAGGDFDLLLDEVEVDDFFGHGVFHLNAGVHLHEVEVAILIDEEFDGAYAFVVDGRTGGNCGGAHFFAQLGGHEWGRAFFDQFLVAALDAAIPFGEVDDFSALVAGDLELDVAGLFDEFFNVDAIVSESGFGFLAGHVPLVFELFFFPDDAHTAAAAAGGGFEDDGVADVFGDAEPGFEVAEEAFATGYDGDAGFDHGFFGRDLIAHFADLLGRWAYELDAVFEADLGEVGIFGEETIPGVDGVGVGDFNGGHDAWDAEV